MKFTVKRASQWGDAKPCEEAKSEFIVRVDTRTFRSPEEYDAKCEHDSGKWLEVGTNHRYTSDGCIQRDFGTVNVWTIEINSLEDMMKFMDKYGGVVITDDYRNGDYKQILIYDDYIE